MTQANAPVSPAATAPTVPSAPAAFSPPLPTCRCGTDRTQRAASPEREYSLVGSMYLLWGGTSVPSRVRFRCIHCGNVFDQCTQRSLCLRYVI